MQSTTISLIAKKISDKQTLQLIGKYLRSEIMIDGVSSRRLSGTPQGSHLSPLLSNILLNELDKELSNRGLSFVRYADDCSIYVRSNRSATRVMRIITKYIEEVLLLQVNRQKSKISRPTASTLLEFSFYKMKGQWRIRIADKSLKQMKEKLQTLLPRNKAQQVRTLMSGLGSVI